MVRYPLLSDLHQDGAGVNPLSAAHHAHISVGGNPYGSRTYGCRVAVLGRRVNGNHNFSVLGLADLGYHGVVRGPQSTNFLWKSGRRVEMSQDYCGPIASDEGCWTFDVASLQLGLRHDHGSHDIVQTPGSLHAAL